MLTMLFAATFSSVTIGIRKERRRLIDARKRQIKGGENGGSGGRGGRGGSAGTAGNGGSGGSQGSQGSGGSGGSGGKRQMPTMLFAATPRSVIIGILDENCC